MLQRAAATIKGALTKAGAGGGGLSRTTCMKPLPHRNGLHRLLYSSRFSGRFPAAFADQEDEIGKIIRASIRRNRDASITGLLLVHRSWFLQALEGPPERVDGIFQRIMTDHRHTDLRVLATGPA